MKNLALQKFISPKIASGLLLFFATIGALLLSNSPAHTLYESFLSTPVHITVGTLEIHKPLLLWINDGLMAVFFFLIGLEIKREVMEGELSSLSKASLPIFAALGGIIVPAMFFVFLNMDSPTTMDGWGIPVATDIAFALAILSLLGDRVPKSLKILLLSLAIIDDIAAILIIALFYTAKLSVMSLSLGGAALLGAALLNRMGVIRKAPYILLGMLAWIFVLKSGVHATLAGVILAFTIPMTVTEGRKHSPLKELEIALHPWVSFLIMPLFAFANAGVYLGDVSLNTLAQPLPLGIIAGLFLGKQLGVFGFIFIAVKSGLSKLPRDLSWTHVYGLAILTGVGFTMSLFIGSLAFEDPDYLSQIRISVLAASLFSAVASYSILKFCTKK